MNKILVFTGVMGCCILVLSAWFFIGEIGGFAKFLGEESEEIANTEKSKFVGTWESQDETTLILLGNTVTFFSDGRVGLQGSMPNYETFQIENEKLIISLSGIQYTFDYLFSNDDNTLSLRNIKDGTTGIYIRQKESIL